MKAFAILAVILLAVGVVLLHSIEPVDNVTQPMPVPVMQHGEAVEVDWSDAVLIYSERTPDLDPAKPPPAFPPVELKRLPNPNPPPARNKPLKFPLSGEHLVFL